MVRKLFEIADNDSPIGDPIKIRKKHAEFFKKRIKIDFDFKHIEYTLIAYGPRRRYF